MYINAARLAKAMPIGGDGRGTAPGGTVRGVDKSLPVCHNRPDDGQWEIVRMTLLNRFSWGVIVPVLLAALSSRAALAASPDPVYAPDGMIVSASRAASEAGIEILREGGNAIDAAVATGFVLAVTHPQAGNLGGGGFLVARLANGKAFTLDFREKAPAAAHKDMFLDKDQQVREGLSLRSHLASGVPGTVDGLLKAWEDHGSGKITRPQLFAAAIKLARSGIPLSRGLAADLNEHKDFFTADPGAAKIFVRADGRLWEAGDQFVQEDLAKTLRRISSGGRNGFYGGPVAAMIARQMRSREGLITEADLDAYESVYREPVAGEFRGHEILSMGPPSSGGVMLIHLLNMLSDRPLEDMGWNGSAYVHLLTEVERRAFADRAEHLGDPDSWKVPVAGLASREYALSRAGDISMTRATPSAEVRAGDPPAAENTETTHYSVADKEGNAVAVTTTLNASYGSGIVVDGAGFLLNNEMDDFSVKPGVPNLFGLVGSEANAIGPGKRMLSSMSPTIVLKDGKPWIIAGSPGGSTIITTVLQVLLNAIVFGMDIQEAVDAPRHHSQWLPDTVIHEDRAFPKDVAEALAAMGHVLDEPAGHIGQANCILVGDDGFYGAPDPRGENAAAGLFPGHAKERISPEEVAPVETQPEAVEPPKGRAPETP